MPEKPFRAHVIAGGFPPGSHAGHDHDYARLRILEMLEAADIPCSVANDYADVEKWLATSRLMITYTAGPVLADPQNELVRKWLQSGGRWLALHGSSGGKAARVEGTSQRRMVRMAHHDTLGAFFINHPPVRRFQVDVPDRDHPLTRGMPTAFEVVDEPYMVEVLRPAESRILMSSALGPDAGGFGFVYETDTALLQDGRTRAIAWVRDVGDGGVAYTTLGHCHNPATNVQPFVDRSVDPEGKTPPTLRVTWEQPAFQRLLSNGIEWGMGA